jgi:hypothetical protein
MCSGPMAPDAVGSGGRAAFALMRQRSGLRYRQRRSRLWRYSPAGVRSLGRRGAGRATASVQSGSGRGVGAGRRTCASLCTAVSAGDPARARAIGSAGERLVHTEEVTGSIPVSPTTTSAAGSSQGPAFLIFVQQQSAAASRRFRAGRRSAPGPCRRPRLARRRRQAGTLPRAPS